MREVVGSAWAFMASWAASDDALYDARLFPVDVFSADLACSFSKRAIVSSSCAVGCSVGMQVNVGRAQQEQEPGGYCQYGAAGHHCLWLSVAATGRFFRWQRSQRL